MTQDSKPDWIPGPHPRGGAEGGWGLYCGPAAWPEVVGDRMASLTPPRGSLGLGVWRCCVRPAVLRPDPGFLCGSGHRPAVSGPVSHLPSRLGSTCPRPRHGVMGRAGPPEADPALLGTLAPAGPTAGLASPSKQGHPSQLRDGSSVPPLPPCLLFRLQNNVYHATLHDTLPPLLPSLQPPADIGRFSWAIFMILIFQSPSPLFPLITFWALFGLLE